MDAWEKIEAAQQDREPARHQKALISAIPDPGTAMIPQILMNAAAYWRGIA